MGWHKHALGEILGQVVGELDKKSPFLAWLESSLDVSVPEQQGQIALDALRDLVAQLDRLATRLDDHVWVMGNLPDSEVVDAADITI